MFDAAALVSVEKAIAAANAMLDPVLKQERLAELKEIEEQRLALIKLTRSLYINLKYVCVCLHRSIHSSIMSVCAPVCPSVRTHPFSCLSDCLSVCLHVCPSVTLSVCMSVCRDVKVFTPSEGKKRDEWKAGVSRLCHRIIGYDAMDAKAAENLFVQAQACKRSTHHYPSRLFAHAHSSIDHIANHSHSHLPLDRCVLTHAVYAWVWDLMRRQLRRDDLLPAKAPEEVVRAERFSNSFKTNRPKHKNYRVKAESHTKEKDSDDEIKLTTTKAAEPTQSNQSSSSTSSSSNHHFTNHQFMLRRACGLLGVCVCFDADDASTTENQATSVACAPTTVLAALSTLLSSSSSNVTHTHIRDQQFRVIVRSMVFVESLTRT
jgi:hypothetical protein